MTTEAQTGRRIGFVGLGQMGLPMARRLLEAGHALTVYNRTAEKARALLALGAQLAAAPGQVAAESEILFSMLADDRALMDAVLGPEGVVSLGKPGLLIIDMSTISPSASATVDAACSAAGLDYLRAPVSGSTNLAAAGELTILASGPRARYDEALALLELLGSRCFYLGPGEEARVMKLALNMMVGVTIASLAEALVFGEKGGLEWRQMLEVFTASAVGSPLLKYKATPLAERDFSSAFTTDLMAKDFDLALDAAGRLGVSAPLAALVRQLLQAASASGWGQRDFAVLVLLVERLSGIGPQRSRFQDPGATRLARNVEPDAPNGGR